jgi:hypothetical protein
MGGDVVPGRLDRHKRGMIAEPAPPALVTAEGG